MLNYTISVIIPTYNEKENIKLLLKKINNIFKKNKILNYEIIIVDDNSPDGTYKIVEELSKKNEYIKLLKRTTKKGLASAVVDGINLSNGNIIIVMDADLQHPPELIPKMIDEITMGCDIVIASRYIPGGKIKDWSFLRKLISRSAILISKALFPKLRYIEDTVSGYFAFKKEIIKDVNLNPRGFKILLEILIKGNYRKIKEIPYVFGGRLNGDSNLSIKIVIDYVIHLLLLIRNYKD